MVVDIHRERLQLLGGDEDQREQEVVPGEDEGEDGDAISPVWYVVLPLALSGGRRGYGEEAEQGEEDACAADHECHSATRQEAACRQHDRK